jgi:shikimate kinase
VTPVVVLIGPPGAGKSTVGPLLAERLAVGFLDTDDAVVATAGKPVADIFIEDGEPAFRALERETVAAALASHQGVLGVGGGAVMQPGTGELLAGLRVVYLEASFPELAKRVGMDRPRPLLRMNPRAQLRALLDQRLPVYQALATSTVSTDGRDPGEIAAQIAGEIATANGAGPAGRP